MSLSPASGIGRFYAKSAKIIRFVRLGCTNRPFYHIVVMEVRTFRPLKWLKLLIGNCIFRFRGARTSTSLSSSRWAPLIPCPTITTNDWWPWTRREFAIGWAKVHTCPRRLQNSWELPDYCPSTRAPTWPPGGTGGQLLKRRRRQKRRNQPHKYSCASIKASFSFLRLTNGDFFWFSEHWCSYQQQNEYRIKIYCKT